MVQDDGLDGRQKKPSPHTPYKENLSLSLSERERERDRNENARVGRGREVDVRQQVGKGTGAAGALPASEASRTPNQAPRETAFSTKAKKNFGLKNKAEVHEIRFSHVTKTLEILT